MDAGDIQSIDHIPIACKDAVAILYMFDLTSRCTLNNILDWYERARKWNKVGAFSCADSFLYISGFLSVASPVLL
jgi:hypothetical protein